MQFLGSFLNLFWELFIFILNDERIYRRDTLPETKSTFTPKLHFKTKI